MLFSISNHSMNVAPIGDCPNNGPTIVLAHNPSAANEIVDYARSINHSAIDLILSGHTHAGQYFVMIPYIYWILPFFYGFYELNHGATKLLVSAGTLYQVRKD